MALGLRSARPKLDSAHASEARAQLALRIAERNVLQDRKAKLHALRWDGNVSTLIWEREEALTAAQAALEAARHGAAQAAALVMAGDDAPAPAITPAEARQAVREAEDGLTAAKGARERLEAETTALELDLPASERRVKLAALAVMREHPATRDLVARVERIQRELLAAGGVMEWLVEHNVLATRDDNGHRLHNDEADRREEARFRMSFLANWAFQTGPRTHQPNGCFPEELGGALKQQAARPWDDALAALHTDANAPLPEIP